MDFSAFDHECMALALRLAEKGLWTSHPNPRVGCVIANGGRVVASGWHRAAGEAHAEVVALADAGERARGGIAYVTLEPCAHEGRTAACVGALIEAGIERVVAAVADPNPRVNGLGFQRLCEAGIEVESGLMEREATALNAGFFSRVMRGRPWLRVKSAQSLDGRTALGNGDSRWISSEASRRDVQNWRARSDAILTGIGTVQADNPGLNVRIDGATRQPLRVIADSGFSIEPDARILNPADQALVVGCSDGANLERLRAHGIECLLLEDDGEGRVDLPGLLEALGRREINEVQVEAGAILCGALLGKGLVDEVLVYQAACLLGAEAPPAFSFGPLESMDQRIHFELIEVIRTGADLRMRFRPAGSP